MEKKAETILRKLIKETIDKEFNLNIPDELYNRVPFFKDYNLIKKTENLLKLQKFQTHSKEETIGGDLYKFNNYSPFSEFIYNKYQIRDNVFYNFILENAFYISKPEEMTDLTYRVLLMANKSLSNRISYRKEVMLKEDKPFSKTMLDEIINELNKKLFEFEELTVEQNIELFKE